MEHPNDATGDALRRLEARGDDLTRTRDIDFSVVFPTEDAAEEFAKQFRLLGYTTSVRPTGTVEELPWDVVVTNNMLPSHDGIEEFEATLEKSAITLGGRNDGWGCFSQQPPSSVH